MNWKTCFKGSALNCFSIGKPIPLLFSDHCSSFVLKYFLLKARVSRELSSAKSLTTTKTGLILILKIPVKVGCRPSLYSLYMIQSILKQWLNLTVVGEELLSKRTPYGLNIKFSCFKLCFVAGPFVITKIRFAGILNRSRTKFAHTKFPLDKTSPDKIFPWTKSPLGQNPPPDKIPQEKIHLP